MNTYINRELAWLKFNERVLEEVENERVYTDLSLMTVNSSIGLKAATVFQALSKGETVDSAHQLLVAPKCLQNRVLDQIDREIEYARWGEEAYIGVKLIH